MLQLQSLITDFAVRVSALIDAEAQARTRDTILRAFGGRIEIAPRRRGRPPKTLAGAKPVATTSFKTRKKAPLQLCPVPGCKNPAAPIFGMVCAKHKDLPKAKIKKFREARRAKKLAAAGRPAAKARRKVRRKNGGGTKVRAASKKRATSKRRAPKAPRKIVRSRAKPAKVDSAKTSPPPERAAAGAAQTPATSA